LIDPKIHISCRERFLFMNPEIARRRTFAIISHPDAGKTTLTEKFLLYGGAVQLAGSVTARKNQRATTSDWMELEKQRGISVSSTVLQFEYRDCVVNLLDTPGHKDFSEDTYRVLTAVDAAIMVIDAGKGIETQTRKLFEVCRQRGVPIFTFMNKLDRPSKPPLDLLDELENILGLHAAPVNWPLGDGPFFKGVFDRRDKLVHLFERTPGGAYRAPVAVAGIADDAVRNALPPDIHERVVGELELLDGAGAEFSLDAVRAGNITPVFFGSAMNNFGVQLLLDAFLEMAPQPGPRRNGDELLAPDHDGFSAFVFKIQANMNPRHRDRATFLRIVSGCFKRDMDVLSSRTGMRFRLGNSQRLFAQDRETVNEAWAGDVIGIVGNYDLQIGDTLSENPGIAFAETPRFAPECFSYLRNSSTAKFKRFRDGLDQLLKEGVAQSFDLPDAVMKVPLLGAVGPLQFEVMQYRMEAEYNAECRLEPAPWNLARWVVSKETAKPPTGRPALILPTGAVMACDSFGLWAVLLPNQWTAAYLEEKNPDWQFPVLPPNAPAAT
jgi:peptide chain release factor 3